MAGGVGSRFWPMSRPEMPKQFLDVLGVGKTLIQMTYERLLGSTPKQNIYIVTNANYTELVKQQLPDIKEHQILKEPVRRNTAPCIAYAAHKIYQENPEANLVVAASDHLITDNRKFTRIIDIAREKADSGNHLVTLGIKPHRPDTGYGYIQFERDGDIIGGQIKQVKKFTEKPNRELAEIFLKSGDYYWNSGIFVWKAATIINAFEKFMPELNHLFGNIAYQSEQEQTEVNKAFEASENISIDFAVMENASNVFVVLADFDWSDLGTWGSLHDQMKKDYNGNAISGDDVHTFETKDCIIKMPTDKKVLIQGLEDFIVVDSDNTLLIMRKKDEQKIKDYLENLK